MGATRSRFVPVNEVGGGNAGNCDALLWSESNG